ncbi:tetratricopeptide repeat protein [Vineibacter terrae]|uniref:Tetratricopeptide repeat protein n=1 Tax=Vineibacter terrae TaxID=2586908 RepID=A0A5C8PDC0_9HYPH|nr:winged helix-turn-helix domain-containing protein [Vineibacter terrae]TXL71385.1 tetratricopeptide repeat protein [Vineibacter terrae]
MQYRFEDYLLDPDRRELTQGSEAIAVGPKVFDLLLYLVQHRDRVVSRDDLLQAVWDGRIVSESTLTSHINALRRAIGDNGETQRLIRTAARKGFRFVGDVWEEARAADRVSSVETGTAGPDEASTPVLSLPDKPSIAVLAFENLSGDPQQEYFADGVVEDIITALSRIGWLFVIARNSSFTYKGRAVDVKQVGRELGVRYVLEGSMRKAANRVRITGQLIDATTGAHIWADRFESALDDIFEVQDRMAEGVVGVIAPQVERAEIERAMRKPTGSLDAYDCYLRALPHFYTLTRKGVDQALALLDRAIAIDPHFALAKALAARCYAWRNPHGWAAAPEAEKANAVRLGQEALRDGADDPTVLWMVGFALWQLRVDPERALALYERALALNPNCAQALALHGWALATAGRPDEAVPPLLKAIRLSPYDSESFFTMTALGCTYLMAGRFDEAITWTSRALRERPSFAPALRFHAACLAELGRVAEARDTVSHLLQQEPTLTVSALRQRAPIFDAKLMDAYLDGLRKAGLPE